MDQWTICCSQLAGIPPPLPPLIDNEMSSGQPRVKTGLCGWCGGSFIGHTRQEYCNDACKRAMKADRAAAVRAGLVPPNKNPAMARARPAGKTFVCCDCQLVTPLASNGQKRCKPCGKQAKLAQHRASYKRNAERIKNAGS